MQDEKKRSTFLRPGWWQEIRYRLRGIPHTREHLFSTMGVARDADLIDEDTLQMLSLIHI